MKIDGNERIVIIPLVEYEYLKKEIATYKECVTKDFILFEGIRNRGYCSGLSWQIRKSLSKDEVLELQTKKLKELEKEVNEHREYISKLPSNKSFDTNLTVQAKLNKIPKWIQNIFI